MSDQSGAITTCAPTRSHLPDCSVHTCAASCTIREPVHVLDCRRGAAAVDWPASYPYFIQSHGASRHSRRVSRRAYESQAGLAHRSVRVYVSYSTRIYTRVQRAAGARHFPRRECNILTDSPRENRSSRRAAVQCTRVCIASFLVRVTHFSLAAFPQENSIPLVWNLRKISWNCVRFAKDSQKQKSTRS